MAEWRRGSDLCVSSVQNHNFVATVGSAIADEPDASCIKADARMVIAAFNAATACEDMGYDGEACVKALPELVRELHAQMTALKYIADALDIDHDTTYISVKSGDKQIAKVTLAELDARAESVMAKCRG